MTKFRKMGVALLVFVLIMSTMTSSVLACTSLGMGKDATADGSVMLSHTCDGWYDHRIQVIPGGTHEEGEMVDIYRDPCIDTKPGYEPKLVGQIPQVKETYTYFHTGYPFMNDQQLMISEYTWSGRSDMGNSEALFVIANLEILALQRTATAREAVELMGALAEEYGYADGGETLIVGDENEVWVFEICGPGPLWTKDSGAPGAHWAAQRVPDDSFFVGANRSRIGVIDFEDKDNFLYSTDITKMAEAMGWYKAGEEFHYGYTFNPEPYSQPFYASRREWRALNLLAPSQKFDVATKYTHYPFAVKPDEKISVQTISDLYSDHYEGTPYDMTTGLAAGAFGNPTRWGVKGDQKTEDMNGYDWERPIALYRCSYSFISQARSWMPDEVGGVLWFGQDSPDTTVYVPIYCSTTETPESWRNENRATFDPNSAWWAFNLVNNWASLQWDAMYPVIRAEKAKLESDLFLVQPHVEEIALELYEEDPAEAVTFLTAYTNNTMLAVEDAWWDFAWRLIGSFNDGLAVDVNGESYTPGYPTEFLEAVDYGDLQKEEFEALTPDAK